MALTAPSGLIAAFSDGPKVLLEWISNDSNATGFQLERTESGTFSVLAIVNASSISTLLFTDNTVQLNKTYKYRVKAFNIFGNPEDSDYSDEVSVTTEGTTITELQIPLGVYFYNILNEYSLFNIEAVVPRATSQVSTYTKSLVLGKSGLISVADNVSFELQVPSDGTLVSWFASIKTASTGADIILDFELDGVSLWALTPANRPRIFATENRNIGTDFDTLSCTAGQIFTLDVKQVGSTFEGDTLTAQLNYIIDLGM